MVHYIRLYLRFTTHIEDMYIEELIVEMEKKGYQIGSENGQIGVVLYADDVFYYPIISSMLDVCASFGISNDVTWNTAKSSVITFVRLATGRQLTLCGLLSVQFYCMASSALS